MKIAEYWEKLPDNTVICRLCPHVCRITSGHTGICRSRKNTDGTLHAINYAGVCSVNIDPVEKKPLYHFLPGSPVLSLGNNGCNLSCAFCQNWQIAHEIVPTETMLPEQVLEMVLKHGTPAVAFTYAEPTIWYEYIIDTAKLLQHHGIRTILVTNGLIMQDPLENLLPFVDAMNIDIKSILPDFYKRLCRGDLQTVLDTATLAAHHCHVEITNLVITGENDTEAEFHQLSEFVARNLNTHTVLHLSRYHPAYRLKNPATPLKTLKTALTIAREYLDYVYLGNVWDADANHTYCPGCGAVLIQRTGYSCKVTGLDSDGLCMECSHQSHIVLS